MLAALRAMRQRCTTAIDAHDEWNLLALGALNLAHIGWWCGVFSASGAALQLLFYADAAYLIADTCWLVFVPNCVAPRNRMTLLAHHLLICTILPVAASKPVLMKHLLRTWVVEVHSWNHIAMRRLGGRLGDLTKRVNLPLFVSLRLLAFPLTCARVDSNARRQLIQVHVHIHGP